LPLRYDATFSHREGERESSREREKQRERERVQEREFKRESSREREFKRERVQEREFKRESSRESSRERVQEREREFKRERERESVWCVREWDIDIRHSDSDITDNIQRGRNDNHKKKNKKTLPRLCICLYTCQTKEKHIQLFLLYIPPTNHVTNHAKHFVGKYCDIIIYNR
jgi:hypothetical protein